MKVSLTWLGEYFDTPLPSVEEIADALTFHAFEIEEAKGDLLDVKILPDRAAYALSHRGIAKELSTVLNLPLKQDPLREELSTYPATDLLSVAVEDQAVCPRYMAALVCGVKVGPSPDWLKEALESVGQRSINNVVDATNFVMLNMGQPLHAFDAAKLQSREGGYALQVRGATEGETITTLSGEEYTLPQGTLLIADGYRGNAIGIAGVKGGKAAEITDTTTDIIIESANFDGMSVRKTAQALKLFTDASSRFQNKPSPALAAYGMRDVLALVLKVAGGDLAGVVDCYAAVVEPTPVSVSLSRLNSILGSSFSSEEVRGAFDRLLFSYTETEDSFTILPPFERQDLTIEEDLVEEVGRILGYDRILPVQLPLQEGAPNQARFRGIEAIKDFLVERGYTEISTPSFAESGDILLENPLQEDRPYLRASLLPALAGALAHTKTVAPRVLGPEAMAKLFELGNVFTKDGELLVLSMGVAPLSVAPRVANDVLKENIATLQQELFGAPTAARYSLAGDQAEISLEKVNLEKLGEDYAPISVRQGAYQTYGAYPSALRDIAVWTPAGTQESEVANAIMKEAGEFLARIDLFDRFEKEGRISYAFRLVFESSSRTLSDADLDPAMMRVTEALNAREGWLVR